MELSKNKYGNFVIKKCISNADNMEYNMIMTALCKNLSE